MRYYSIISAAVCLVFLMFLQACKNNPCSSSNMYTEYQQKPINGRLYYQNTLSSTGDLVALSNTTVYLLDANDITATGVFNGNYILSTVTDSAGNFAFQYQNCESLYLYASAIVNNVNYSSFPPTPIGSLLNNGQTSTPQFILTPVSNSSLVITVKDLNTQEPLRGLLVALYTNASAVGDTAQSAAKGIADNNGIVSFYNITAANYYVSLTGAVNVIYNGITDSLYYNSTIFYTKQPNAVNAQNVFIPATITYAIPSKTDTMQVLVVDTSYTPISGVTVGLYTDSTMAGAVSSVGANAQLATLANGTITFSGINPYTQYYVSVNGYINGTGTTGSHYYGVKKVALPAPANVELITVKIQ